METSMSTNRKLKWLAMLAGGACMFQFAGCVKDALFLVAPFIV
jgi:hypothetical protein